MFYFSWAWLAKHLWEPPLLPYASSALRGFGWNHKLLISMKTQTKITWVFWVWKCHNTFDGKVRNNNSLPFITSKVLCLLNSNCRKVRHRSTVVQHCPHTLMAKLVVWAPQRDQVLFLWVYMGGKCESSKTKKPATFACYLGQTILDVWEACNCLFFFPKIFNFADLFIERNVSLIATPLSLWNLTWDEAGWRSSQNRNPNISLWKEILPLKYFQLSQKQ